MEKQIIKYKIVRETSKYNKYIKWFAKCFREDNTLVSSFGYRTEKEARKSVIPIENPFPIGNRFIKLELKEI